MNYQLVQDVRYGIRILWKAPGLSATVVILIALVVGGNTTIFSMVHQVLTMAAPGVAAEGLVMLGVKVGGNVEDPGISYPNYLDAVALSKTVRPLLAAGGERFTLTTDTGSFSLFGSTVTSNYFETLGVTLLKGRTFTPDESTLSGVGLAAIVSHRVWQTYLNGSEDVIGKPIVLNGHTATVVGVASPRFRGTTLGGIHDIWVPLTAYNSLAETVGNSRRSGSLLNRARPSVEIFGRLVPGRTLKEAREEFALISERLQTEYPEANRNKSIIVEPYAAVAFTPAGRLAAPVFLTIFSVVTLLTLLIVCANVGNLMLARAVIRQREMAVRQSLGASRFRVLLLMISEGLALSLTGWLGSFGFIVVVSKLVPRLLQADLDLTPDWRAAFLSLVLILLSTIAFMLAPALGAWRQHVLPWLKAGEQGIVGGRSNLSNFLAIVQLAFAVLLLTAAGLAWRSLSLVDPNLRIDKDNLLVVTVNTAGSASSAETNQILLDRLSDRLRAINRVSMVSHLRNRPDIFWSELAVRSDAAQEPVLASSNVAGPGYLRTIGVTPILGRDFSDADTERTDKSVIINQNLADSLWPGEAAIGRTVMVGPRSEPMQVIGVAPNAFFGSFTGKQKPNFIFLSARQSPSTPGDTTYYIRYRDGSDTIATAVTTALKETDSHVSVVRSRTMEEVLADVLRPLTVVTSLLSIFATGSLAIAAIGLYGAVAFSMVRRTREFGVRMALGASTNQVLTSVMREGLLLTLAGLAGGMTLSVIAGLAMRRLLYGVTPTDGLTYVGVFVLLATASLLACYFPARRASRVDPLVSLRHE